MGKSGIPPGSYPGDGRSNRPPATKEINMKLKLHYDKLLHVLGTFTAMCFLRVAFPWYCAVMVVFGLQLIKVWLNYRADELYHPAGDMVANMAGYGLYWIYSMLRVIS